MSSPPPHCAIIGGGLVGTLCASMLSQRGFSVTVYESRPDPRLVLHSASARSINLALSPRGIEALRSVSPALADRVVKEGVRMRGRMLHTKKNRGRGRTAQDYGVYEEGEFISSISRGLLGVYLLEHLDGLGKEGDKGGKVEVVFGSKLVEMDLRREKGVEITIRKGGKEGKTEKTVVDFVVGGDGAYSKVRGEMMRGTRFDYRQNYAKHSYLELSIPAGPPLTEGGESTWSIEPNFLHIWPRGDFMLIALPNQDKSFTLTLFAPVTTFEELDAKLAKVDGGAGGANPIVELFEAEFPDALELMGEEGLLKSWRENPKDGLITVECSPYHHHDKAILIGDAAHAMVPFYGQGMNCAFEDVRVLSTLLDHFRATPHPSPLPSTPLPLSSSSLLLPSLPLSSPSSSALALAFSSYTLIRTSSLSAIQSLAKSNYDEMASSVLDPLYIIRLTLDGVLSRFFEMVGRKEGGGRGGRWESLYRMVTFRYGLGYEEAVRRRQGQTKVLEGVLSVLGGVMLAGVVAGGMWARRRR